MTLETLGWSVAHGSDIAPSHRPITSPRLTSPRPVTPDSERFE